MTDYPKKITNPDYKRETQAGETRVVWSKIIMNNEVGQPPSLTIVNDKRIKLADGTEKVLEQEYPPSIMMTHEVLQAIVEDVDFKTGEISGQMSVSQAFQSIIRPISDVWYTARELWLKGKQLGEAETDKISDDVI